MAKAIIIDDEFSILELMSQVCRSLGHEVHARQTGSEGLAAIAQLKPELLIVDLHIGDVNGLDIIKQCRKNSTLTAIIMVTGHGSVETAVEAMRLGAFDYLTKPFELTDLKRTIAHALGKRPAPVVAYPASASTPALASQLIGNSPAIQKITGMIQRLADNASPVLLEGEFGVGKQLVARVLHQSSQRASAPFRAIQCSALPPELLEEELFGHDHKQDAGGIFARTRGGTVHLAEIHHMPMRIQAQLNACMDRLVEDPAACRLVTSTTQPLEEAIRKGNFREDLYYKISVVPIHIPPLRERRQDIPLLVEHILREQAQRAGAAVKPMERYAAEFLEKYPWPGNISELRNAVERACALSERDVILPSDLPVKITQKGISPEADPSIDITSSLPIGSSLDSFVRAQEKLFISETLKYNNGSREKTASMLGVSIATLYRKMELNVERRTTV